MDKKQKIKIQEKINKTKHWSSEKTLKKKNPQAKIIKKKRESTNRLRNEKGTKTTEYRFFFFNLNTLLFLI